MPHLHRFFIPPETLSQSVLRLEGPEAHHALRVVRVREGGQVVLFDGQGRTLHGQVQSCAKQSLSIAIEREEQHPAPAPALALAQAWLHRDKAIDYLVRHGTELGVSAFHFFPAEHSERTPRHNPKWRRAAIETCKQSGHAWLPEFHCHDSMAGALEAAPGRILVAALDTTPQPMAGAVGEGPATLFTGPEGDFTQEEIEILLARKAHPISLGQATFRAEAAAIHAAVLIRYHQGRLGPPPPRA